MWEILKAIDLLLQNRVVRWALLVITVIITAFFVYYRLQYAILGSKYTARNTKAAGYELTIDRQNAAIQQAAAEYDVMAKNLDDAAGKAQALQKQLAQRKVEVREIRLVGTCDEMVQQIVTEVRK